MNIKCTAYVLYCIYSCAVYYMYVLVMVDRQGDRKKGGKEGRKICRYLGI